MTDDRIFKNKVKEVAELNGLSYTEAKRAAIELNRKIKEHSKFTNSNFKMQLEDLTEDDIAFLNTPLFQFNSSKKSLKLDRTYNKYGTHIKLSSNPDPECIIFSPFNNNIDYIPYSNVIETQSLVIRENDLRLAYFTLIEDFGEERSYFVDTDNFFSQMPKLIKIIESYNEKEDLLIGIASPYKLKEKMSSNKMTTLDNFMKKISKLLEAKNFCLITNQAINNKNIAIIDSHKDFMSSKLSTSFKWHNQQIKYYPFDKFHGGSHYQSINKTVLGYVEGKPQFNDAHLVLIESNDETCVENIRKTNKANGNVKIWDKNTEALGLQKKMFVKIDYEMTDAELNSFAIKVYKHFRKEDYPRAEELIVETPDAERMQMFLDKQKKNFLGNDSFYDAVNIDIERYTLIDGCLYSENHGEISLYKN